MFTRSRSRLNRPEEEEDRLEDDGQGAGEGSQPDMQPSEILNLCRAEMQGVLQNELADINEKLSALMLNMPAPQNLQSRGGMSMKIKPQIYDGKEEWEPYRAQFELIAQKERWDDDQKAAMLGASLKGQALTLLTELGPDMSYHDLLEALEIRFGSRHQTTRYLALLQTRVQGADEDVRTFHQAIKDLVRRAWPDARGGAAEDTAIFHFARGLGDARLCELVLGASPKTMANALNDAVRMEAVLQWNNCEGITAYLRVNFQLSSSEVQPARSGSGNNKKKERTDGEKIGGKRRAVDSGGPIVKDVRSNLVRDEPISFRSVFPK
ncbi:hypothetical protein GE061_007457 [Apolygus lucorum]|uniref:Retrotransposon gag domain-containing protein n=1 Tax=Apolygus lucorum TaxID=248454 RepID=A0A8S9WTH7_APOLU|nr:hypothetical protein GE061_007457 [Apolygus lucorum]